MKCPYCGEEMERGDLIATRAEVMAYLPGGQSSGLFPMRRSIEKKGGIVLDGPYWSNLSSDGTGAYCFACKKCEFIFVPYGNCRVHWEKH